MNLEKIVAGDTLDFNVSVPDYPASDGWTLKYAFTARFTTPTQATITLTASTASDGETYDVQAGPATTANWASGLYTWARWVEKAGARQTLDESGQLEVRPDPSTSAQGFDSRSTARKAVEELETALATFNSTSGRVKSYTIAGRSMEFETSAEILRMLSFWQQRVRQEEAELRLAKGLQGSPTRIQARF